MPVEIDFPLPGVTLSPTITAGGTYDATGKTGTKRVRVILRDSSDSEIITVTTGDLSPDVGPWSAELPVPGPYPRLDCVLRARLLINGSGVDDPDEVADLDVETEAVAWVEIRIR